MKSRSMTRRLTLWLCGATLLVWISVAAIAVLMLHKAVNELYDRLLELTSVVAVRCASSV
ncbi:hypothetical protein CK223_32340 [Mesorhizobium loti]|nr:hypothetical protein CK223_32340 [Mesorhizobium loti]